MNRNKHPNRNSQQDRKGYGRVKNEKNDPSRGGGKAQKSKHQDYKEGSLNHITPKTRNQEKLLSVLKRCQVVVSCGSSGSGKTYISCVHAANRLLMGEVDKIILTRPTEGPGKTIGFRPGEVEDKLSSTYQSMIDPLKKALGGGSHYQMLLKQGKIVLEALEDIRGRSYRKCCIIVDEASNTDVKTMQTAVTRLGEGSQIIFCGDSAPWQKDIKGESGLTWLIRLVKKLRRDEPDYLDEEDWSNLYNNIGIVEFTREDVVRSGITKLFVKSFDEEG